MESQPRDPEFRIDHENLHPCMLVWAKSLYMILLCRSLLFCVYSCSNRSFLYRQRDVIVKQIKCHKDKQSIKAIGLKELMTMATQ